jgi:PTS system nitrogen regulatory IIA component
VQLTIRQTAELLHVSEDVVRRWIREGGLPAVRCNEQYRLNRVDLLVWAQTNQIALPAQIVAAPAPGAISLFDALDRGGIHRDVEGEDRAAVLRAAVCRLRLPDAVDRELLLEMVAAREAQGSTAIGSGIAVPHVRYPNVAPVADPILSLCLLRSPVDFGARDGVAVESLFVLVAPTIRAHLGILARLASALSGELLQLVKSRASDALILAAARAHDAAANESAAGSARR